jgi:hypothetical protein
MMDDDHCIILSCPGCNMAFFIEALTEDMHENVPNPLFCPFCSYRGLEEGFNDYTMLHPEPSHTTKTKPKLTLLFGGQDEKSREDRHPNYGNPKQSEGLRQDDKPRHPYER